MDFNFNTQEELYERIRPALHAKIEELNRLNFKGIKEKDIWDYLSDIKWKKAKNLMLSDIVSDIIHLDNKRLDIYLKEKNKVEV